jgi:2-polyprenyl-3-methyl-5-hydroxy-6-metoxy-1,4-benzoquinol methylase
MDTNKMHDLAFRVVGDMGGAFTAALGYVGIQLGLYKAMAGAGALSSDALAAKTGLNERYVREWAKAMVAAEYLDYEAETKKFVMTDEQAFVLTNEDSPLFVGGGLQLATPTICNVPKIMDAFKNGGGVKYSELGDEIPGAIEQFFRPSYLNFLTQDWLTRIPGLVEKLERGARIADIGCGCGQSTVIMAAAYPNSKVVGIDNDRASIESARRLAERKGAENAEFLCTTAEEVAAGGEKYDLICSLDCIHDMADPLSALRAIREALETDGVYVWSEPNGSDNPLENRNPVGKSFAAASPLHCLTVSLAHGGAGLGTVIGEKGARRIAEEAGFSSFERLPVEHPFIQVFALRK